MSMFSGIFPWGVKDDEVIDGKMLPWPLGTE
jgi:hypothetical protein